MAAESPSLAGSTPMRRSNRERKRNRASDALEKIKLSRQTGIRQEEELETPDSLFEEVTEEEYAQLIHKRQRDNFVLDNDGTYCEHGREIFDEEVSVTLTSSKAGKKQPKSSPRNKKIKISPFSPRDAATVGVSTPPRKLTTPTIKRVEMPLKRERVIKEEKVTPLELEPEFQDNHNNHLMDVSY